jgi:hypothetical protein
MRTVFESAVLFNSPMPEYGSEMDPRTLKRGDRVLVCSGRTLPGLPDRGYRILIPDTAATVFSVGEKRGANGDRTTIYVVLQDGKRSAFPASNVWPAK